MAQIQNEEEFEAWLKKQDQRTHTTIATRAALRVLPTVFARVDQNTVNGFDATLLLACLRAILVSGVASTCPSTHERAVRGAADDTSRSVSAAASSAEGAPALSIHSASGAVLAASNFGGHTQGFVEGSVRASINTAAGTAVSRSFTLARLMARTVTYLDAEYRQPSAFMNSLWPTTKNVEHLKEMWTEFAKRGTNDPVWGFWVHWYQGFWHGAPINWDLQLRIVLELTDEEWDAGPETVARRIEEIRDDWLQQALPQTDRLHFDYQTLKLSIVQDTLNAEKLVETTLKQVEFSLSTLNSSNCGLNSSSTAWIYIQFTLDQCRDDANAIEQNLDIAQQDIETGLKEARYQDDPKLTALKSMLERAIMDLRANHPDVADAWETRIKYKLKDATHKQKQFIVEASTMLAEVSTERLAEELKLDAKTIAQETGEAPKTATRRFFGRIAQMNVIVKTSEFIKKLDASSGYKGTRIAQTIQDLLNFIFGLGG